MKRYKTMIFILVAFIIICVLYYKVNYYKEQIIILNNELNETHNYYKSTINNIRHQYENSLKDSLYVDSNEDELLSGILGFDINNIKEADKNNWYYYHRLSEEQKKIYEEILLNIIKRQSYTFNVYGFTEETIWNFLKYIQYDHERIFWIDWNAPDSLKYNQKSGEFVIKGQAYDGFETTDKICEAWIRIEEYKEKALGDIDQKSKEQIEKQIYNYIITHTQYNVEAPMGQSLYSTVLGETVCTGYSKMFKYLCNEAGINCISIFGKIKETKNNHLWNIVDLNGKTYMVDCIGGLRISNKGDVCISYDNFNTSLKYMSKDYEVNEYFEIK